MKIIFGFYIIICLIQIYIYYIELNLDAMFEVMLQIGLVIIILSQEYILNRKNGS